MRIFSLKKFIETSRSDGDSKERINFDLKWAKQCDGKKVVNGFVMGTGVLGKKFSVADEWCEEVQDE